MLMGWFDCPNSLRGKDINLIFNSNYHQDCFYLLHEKTKSTKKKTKKPSQEISRIGMLKYTIIYKENIHNWQTDRQTSSVMYNSMTLVFDEDL